jgi:hypothetical protein
VTGQQNWNGSAVFALEFNFIFDHTAITFHHFLEGAPILRSEVKIGGKINSQKLFL